MEAALILTPAEAKDLFKRLADLESTVERLVNNPAMVQWVRIHQALPMLGIKSRDTIRRMCRDGELVYRNVGRTVHIESNSIAKFKAKTTITK